MFSQQSLRFVGSRKYCEYVCVSLSLCVCVYTVLYVCVARRCMTDLKYSPIICSGMSKPRDGEERGEGVRDR